MLSRGYQNGRAGNACSARVTSPAWLLPSRAGRGEVGAGDEIVKVADGPERITVADIDALLYLPNPSREQLERSLQVTALSQGWKTSLKAIAEQKTSEGGNSGLKASTGPPPAWPGFRPLRVARGDREAANVVSLSIEHMDGAFACSFSRTVSGCAAAHNPVVYAYARGSSVIQSKLNRFWILVPSMESR
jgi:hypothetical protein